MTILSIQSHVSYGHVGNSSAVFPLQRLGAEVWPVNTVAFSNHTGYGSWRGVVLGAAHVREIVTGIAERGVLSQCDAVLSGYLGDAEIGEAVLEALQLVRRENPKALFCCDPVMGDYGCGFFVREGIPAVMREKMVPASDIATPNQFELEALTGIELVDMESAARATSILHDQGVRVVLVTSFHPRALAAGHISMLVSENGVLHSLETPELPLSPRPNGAGDLTAAIFLARYLQGAGAVQALELTADAVYSVLERTLEEGKTELALVGAQDDIASPPLVFKAARRFLP